MAVNIVIPSESQSMNSAFLSKWYVKVGDKVDFATPLCEVESDKASFDIESPISGTVLAIYCGEQENVAVSDPIAVIGELGENLTDFNKKSVKPEKENIRSKECQASAANLSAPTPAAANADSSIEASPKAVRFAREHAVALDNIPSRPIHYQDVVDELSGRPRFTAAADEQAEANIIPSQGTGLGGRITAADFADTKREELLQGVPLTGMRKIIADRMFGSLQTTAQFTLNSNADAARLIQLKKRVCERYKVTVNDFVCYATVKTLEEMPELSGRFENGLLSSGNEHINLGVAVDTPRGLLVPVLHDAQLLNLEKLASSLHELICKGKEGKSAPAELKGGTFTVSNLGMMGVSYFTPILNAPELAILGVGRIELHPVRRNGEICFADKMGLSLTVNHQIIDGSTAARFLQKLINNIENIDLLGF